MRPHVHAVHTVVSSPDRAAAVDPRLLRTLPAEQAGRANPLPPVVCHRGAAS